MLSPFPRSKLVKRLRQFPWLLKTASTKTLLNLLKKICSFELLKHLNKRSETYMTKELDNLTKIYKSVPWLDHKSKKLFKDLTNKLKRYFKTECQTCFLMSNKDNVFCPTKHQIQTETQVKHNIPSFNETNVRKTGRCFSIRIK